jgi:hypothetical protein
MSRDITGPSWRREAEGNARGQADLDAAVAQLVADFPPGQPGPCQLVANVDVHPDGWFTYTWTWKRSGLRP